MHNLQKIKLYRILLFITYPLSLIFIYPLALCKKKNDSGLFFFFDRYILGGAQIVHLDILNALQNKYKRVYFTRLSPDDSLKNQFYNMPATECRDIHNWCENLLIRLFTVHYYAFYLNRHQDAHIFSSNCTFFFDMLPFLSKKIIKTELLHSFSYGKNGIEFFGLGSYRYLNYRITVDNATRVQITEQYKEYGVPEKYTKRLLLIEPGVALPEQKPQKNFESPLKIIYAGRGGYPKRIPLMSRIAESLIRANLPVEFHFAGTPETELSDYVKEHSKIHGQFNGAAGLYTLYAECHVVLMTSAHEGFPMMIKEGMVNGCIPVTTALEGIKMHLTNKENGMLIPNPEDEEQVVQQGIEILTSLSQNMDDVQRLSNNAYTYSTTHFDKALFDKKYQEFFTNASIS